MSDREQKIAEIERLRKIEEVNRLRDEDQKWRQANEMAGSAGNAAMEAIGEVSGTIDRGLPWGAPLNAAIGAYQKGEPMGQAYMNQYLRDNEAAPSDKEIMAGMGVSEEEFDTPFIKNPFTLEKYKASPAGIAGGVYGAVKDPTTWVPGVGSAFAMKKGAALADTVAPKMAGSMSRFAEERAAKAATGENRSAIKKFARVNGKSPGDVNRAMENYRKVGRHLLEEDAAGAPAVGWFSNSEEIARNAEAKRKFYGKKIGEVGDTVDQITPGSTLPQDLAEDVSAYRGEVPNVGKGASLRKRLAEESENLGNYGLDDGQHGPPSPLNFKDLQEIKAQYPYEPQSPDLLISNKDVTNKLHGIVGKRQDQAVTQAARAQTRGELEKQGLKVNIADENGLYYGTVKDRDGNVVAKVSGFRDPDGNLMVTQAHVDEAAQRQGLATHLVDSLQEQSGATKVIFDGDQTEAGKAFSGAYGKKKPPLETQYSEAKDRYGTYKNVSDAGSEQALRTIGRRMVSPSSHAVGIGTALKTGADLKTGGLYGAAAAATNQLLLSRGSAFAARSANAVSRRLMNAPQTYRKWLPVMQKAAVGGNMSVLAAHHQLMNNDPEYRQLMMQGGDLMAKPPQRAEEP